jgi:hypothetical protein
MADEGLKDLEGQEIDSNWDEVGYIIPLHYHPMLVFSSPVFILLFMHTDCCL